MVPQKILITGGFGYIGGRVAKFLVAEGFQVFLGSRSDRQDLSWLPQAKPVCINFDQEDSLKRACQGMDAVIHLAGPDAATCLRDFDRAHAVKTVGTQKLVDAAFQCGVKRLVNFSTVHVYGQPLTGHLDESRQPLPGHRYGQLHLAAEAVLKSSQHHFEAVAIFRLSNSFGPPAWPEIHRWDLVSNDLCRQAVTDQRLVLNTTGLQKRNFITLTDVCRATAHVLQCEAKLLKPLIFNLGSELTESILEMAGRVADVYARLYHQKIAIERPLADQPNETVAEFFYNISRLKGTGFQPTDGIDEEIGACLRFCQKHFGR